MSQRRTSLTIFMSALDLIANFDEPHLLCGRKARPWTGGRPDRCGPESLVRSPIQRYRVASRGSYRSSGTMSSPHRFLPAAGGWPGLSFLLDSASRTNNSIAKSQPEVTIRDLGCPVLDAFQGRVLGLIPCDKMRITLTKAPPFRHRRTGHPEIPSQRPGHPPLPNNFKSELDFSWIGYNAAKCARAGKLRPVLIEKGIVIDRRLEVGVV